MDITAFNDLLVEQNSDESLIDFCRKYVVHGTPILFEGREDEHYEFKKRIASEFSIPYHEVFITGSSKLGFSPFKNKQFDYDSDIDVALISPSLFDSVMEVIAGYQMKFRKNRYVVREGELKMYHEFLEYVALGWIRPDKLPVSFQMKTLKNDWFHFFNSISNGSSEVGNYKVSAGVFKNYEKFEAYTVSGMKDVRRKLMGRKK